MAARVFRLGGRRDLSAYGITQFTAPFGWITYPQAMAMWCRPHMIEYGTNPEQLGEIAVTFRESAMLNPRAMQREPMSMDDYMGSRQGRLRHHQLQRDSRSAGEPEVREGLGRKVQSAADQFRGRDLSRHGGAVPGGGRGKQREAGRYRQGNVRTRVRHHHGQAEDPRRGPPASQA